MDLMSLEEFKKEKTTEYQHFINENPSTGLLKVEVFTAYKAVPIPNTEILITKKFNDTNVVFFRGYTNSSGIIDNIKLNAPKSVADSTPYITPQYTLYDLTAIHKEYETIKEYNIGMFGNVNIIKYVKMNPDVHLKGVDTFGN